MDIREHLERGESWRRATREALEPLSVPLAVAAGAKAPFDQIVMIDARAVQRADECLASSEPDGDEYVETAARARRRVGLAVLRELRDRPDVDPLTAFEEVIARRSERLPDRLVEWVDGLGRGGLAALGAEAVGYASAVAAWVPPARMGDVNISDPAEWLSWQVPGRALRIRARCDALAPRRARPPDRRLLVVANRLDHARSLAGHTALAYTLQMGQVPARVTVLAPATGRELVEVDDDLLGSALDSAAGAVHAAVATRFGSTPATSPGPWCRGCGRRGECEPGSEWIAAHPARIGGLVVPLR